MVSLLTCSDECKEDLRRQAGEKERVSHFWGVTSLHRELKNHKRFFFSTFPANFEVSHDNEEQFLEISIMSHLI